MPGDLESAIHHSHKSGRMYAAEPALEAISILGKYGPWKDCLLQAWRQVQKPGPRSRVSCDIDAYPSGLLRRAVTVWHVCTIAVEVCSKKSTELESWVDNVGFVWHSLPYGFAGLDF